MLKSLFALFCLQFNIALFTGQHLLYKSFFSLVQCTWAPSCLLRVVVGYLLDFISRLTFQLILLLACLLYSYFFRIKCFEMLLQLLVESSILFDCSFRELWIHICFNPIWRVPLFWNILKTCVCSATIFICSLRVKIYQIYFLFIQF